MNVKEIAIGLAVALIISASIILGLNIFIPAPKIPNLDFNYSSCATGDQACLERKIKENERLQTKYNESQKIYGEEIFIKSSAVGFVIIVLGMVSFIYLGVGTSIGGGIIIGGAFGLLYGYILGWGGTSIPLKFGIVAALVILIIASGILAYKKYANNLRGQ